MSNSPDATTLALDGLRGQPNPFENLVRPQRPDDRFVNLHVPDLLRAPRELLLAVIDSYRLTEYRTPADLRDTGVVVVLGDRGAGKTHMLEALAHRTDGRRQLLIRPSYFEADVPFEEYLRDRIVDALLTDDPELGQKPFRSIAAQLTRRLLRQALRGLGPTDRLFATHPSAWHRWRLLWGGGELRTVPFVRLAADLSDPTCNKEMPQLAGHHGIAPELLYQFAVVHIDQSEQGDDVLAAIRRELYRTMARTTILRDGEAFGEFLETEYRLPNARPFFRADLLRQQLHALVEACVLVQLPVVIAFDNLEGMLSPQGKFDPSPARALMDGLAQAVDATRGLLFLVFAEKGLFQEVRRNTHDFALNRMDQGVPMRGRAPVDQVELKPPSFDELRQLIRERVGRLLKVFPEASQLADGFPYDPAFLQDLAGRSALTLRGVMLRLRDEYSRVVYGRSAPAPSDSKPPVDWNTVMERLWTDKLAEVDPKMQNSPASQAPTLHAGLRQILEQAGACADWEVVEVKPMTTEDGHTLYSRVTVVDWRQASTANNGAPVRVSVGFLLAQARNMPRDLKAKLALLPDAARQADYLVTLWPRTADDDLVTVLPPKTKEEWDEGARLFRGRALRSLADDALRKLLAFPEWQDALRGLADPAVPDELVRSFVQRRCRNVLELALPPARERSANHAN